MFHRVLALVSATLLAACGGGGDDPVTCSVGYSVAGSLPADLTYATPTGTVQERITFPAFKAYTFKEGEFLYISAQTTSSSPTASITVSISKNGDASYKSASSFGAFKIATASGSC